MGRTEPEVVRHWLYVARNDSLVPDDGDVRRFSLLRAAVKNLWEIMPGLAMDIECSMFYYVRPC